MLFDLEKTKIRFAEHKRAAKQRGIGFLLTFDEWLGIWIKSGKLGLRGSGPGKFVMARSGDKGPYAIGNVRIITSEANHAEMRHKPEIKKQMAVRMRGNTHALGKKLSKETRDKMSAAKTGVVFSEKTKNKISKALTANKNALGHKHSAESRKKMSIAVSAARKRERLAREAL